MTYVLSHSLNVGAIRVLQLEGPKPFYDSLQRFGIGRKTGVDVADEVAQPLPPLSQRRQNELATMTFGQGIAVTPIEMLSALNTIAAGGKLVRPQVATALIDASGKRSELPADRGTQVITPQTNEEMRQMMINVVEKGSGWTVKMDGWKGRIAGKTGTANVPAGGKYTSDTIATFAGFMPADKPRFTMIVIMRKPKGGGLMNIGGPLGQEGTFAAAPTWKQIAQQILLQWQITP
jgi:stage V sporulation protein D (sporulation-specific penicillin-binding protein)